MCYLIEFSLEVLVPIWIILLTLCCWYNPIFMQLVVFFRVFFIYCYELYDLNRHCFQQFVVMFWTLVLLCHLILDRTLMISDAWYSQLLKDYGKMVAIKWGLMAYVLRFLAPRSLGRVIENLIWLFVVNFDVAWSNIWETIH